MEDPVVNDDIEQKSINLGTEPEEPQAKKGIADQSKGECNTL